MVESQEFSAFSKFATIMKEANDPKLLAQEEVYLRLANRKITFEDLTSKKKVQDANLVLTTHRIIIFKEDAGLEIPVFYVSSDYKTGGGMLKTPFI
eukprot:CAMPEP_0176395178 /NCGR_PEP_ID=MMETSP0126-20121128/43196_1 /TAXON_ID=141414 ORGANISM="Strombidinopsis acuminatum, Strain SPMC142" /NCGR_SAMPLE_ID=MMETSP0126 /ASSEMBLY_ACC=CAM_ASM_000229 /LENGTH=95 /DNA_ID=CAMNT_0017767891 /DNA_START=15 /DNA_END=302 /DNA_ORIENTATION=-